jgi:hypothetical protein
VKEIAESDFLAWTKGKGMALHPKYPDSRSLIFWPDLGNDRFWTLPERAGGYPYFIETMLRLAGPTDRYLLWSHLGSWRPPLDDSDPQLKVQQAILKAFGITESSERVIEFAAQEIDTLVTILFVKLTFGWCEVDDMFVIPGQGDVILKTSHHDVVEAYFENVDRMSAFVQGMADEGFDLPRDLPDETFRRPDWMSP